MPRYRVNAPFGPWRRGEEFESTDPWHARIAEGNLLTEVGDPPAEATAPEAGAYNPEEHLGFIVHRS